MKVLNTLAELKAHLSAAAVDLLEALIASIEGDHTREACITSLLGGPACLIENRTELAFVQSAETEGGRFVSLADRASGWFDVAEWTSDGAYARFATIDNADGGTQYFVPAHIAAETPSVGGSIDAFEARMSG